MALTIPDSHRDLFIQPVHGVLSTLMPDGQPQSSIVWVDYDGEYVLINTTLERQKGRNLCADPRVTLLVIDPQNASRWIEVRGRVAQVTQVGAEAHADKLTQRYTGKRISTATFTRASSRRKKRASSSKSSRSKSRWMPISARRRAHKR